MVHIKNTRNRRRYFIIKSVLWYKVDLFVGTLTDLSSYICDDINNPEISHLREIDGAFTKLSLSNPLTSMERLFVFIACRHMYKVKHSKPLL